MKDGICCDTSTTGGICRCYVAESDRTIPHHNGIREQMYCIVDNEPLDAGDTLMGSIARECVRLKLARINEAGQYLPTEYGKSLVDYWSSLPGGRSL